MDRSKHSAGLLSTGDVVNRAQVECREFHTGCAVCHALVEYLCFSIAFVDVGCAVDFCGMG